MPPVPPLDLPLDIVERMLEQVDALRSVLSKDRTSAHL